MPIIRIRDLKEQSFVTYTTENHPKGHLIQPGDIVVGMDGEFRPYIWGNTEAWLNQRVCIFDNNKAIFGMDNLNEIKITCLCQSTIQTLYVGFILKYGFTKH